MRVRHERPDTAVAVGATILIVITWAVVRLHLFADIVLPLTYVLPLLLAVWTRRSWLLWSTVAALLIVHVLKFYVVLPPGKLEPYEHRVVFVTMIINMALGAVVVQLILFLRDSLDLRARQLAEANAELVARNALIEQQNEELRAQAEELAQQNEEIQTQAEEVAEQNTEIQAQAEELERQAAELEAQTEELQTTNLELGRRESMLSALLELARSLRGEPEVMAEVCRSGLALMGGAAESIALLEADASDCAVRAHAGFSEEPPLQRWGLEQGLCSISMEHRRTAYVEDLGERPDLLTPHGSAQRPRSALSTVVSVGGEPIGAVEFYSAEPRQWTTEQFRLAEWIAAQCSVILETLRLQDELRRSEHHHRQVLEALPQLVWTARPDGAWDYLSSQWCEYTGTRETDQIGFGAWAQAVHSDDRTTALAAWQSALRRGSFEVECRIRRADAQYRWFQMRGTVIRDERGRISRWFGSCTDIDANKMAERRLHQFVRALGRLIELSADVVSAHGVDELLQRAADAARELTGARLATAGYGRVDGRFRATAHSAESEPEGPLARSGVLELPSRHHRLLEQQDGDGNRLSHDGSTLRAVLTNADGSATGLLAVSQKTEGTFTSEDDALLKQLGTIVSVGLQQIAARTEAEEANRAKDHFLAVLSHELRTPLTPVLMTASAWAAEDGLPAQLLDDLSMIRRNVEMEVRLIDDLLDLNRVARGKLELRRDLIAAHDKLRAAVEICRSDAAQKGITLRADLDAPQHHVRGDGGRLQQVCWNLVKNAIKFTPPGGHVRIRTSNPRPDILRLQVADDGIGIDPTQLNSLFKPFQQLQQPGSGRMGGLGLGLAISKALVELHGGEIHAQSDGVGCGAVFSVDLPTTEPHPQGSRPSAQELPPAGSRQRILLVEDHAATLEVMARLLRKWGYEIVTADSMASAIEVATGAAIDLVVSDIGLPDGTGTELMRRLRDEHPALLGIALSGYGMENDLQASREAGFAEHLTKPVNFQLLQSAIARVLEAAAVENPETAE